MSENRDINLDVVWDTVQTALLDLLVQLPSVKRDADEWIAI